MNMAEGTQKILPEFVKLSKGLDELYNGWLSNLKEQNSTFNKGLIKLMRERKKAVRLGKVDSNAIKVCLPKESVIEVTEKEDKIDDSQLRGRSKRLAAQLATQKTLENFKNELKIKLYRPTENDLEEKIREPQKKRSSEESPDNMPKKKSQKTKSRKTRQLQKKRLFDESPENTPPKKSLERECQRDICVNEPTVINIAITTTNNVSGETTKLIEKVVINNPENSSSNDIFESICANGSLNNHKVENDLNDEGTEKVAKKESIKDENNDIKEEIVVPPVLDTGKSEEAEDSNEEKDNEKTQPIIKENLETNSNNTNRVDSPSLGKKESPPSENKHVSPCQQKDPEIETNNALINGGKVTVVPVVSITNPSSSGYESTEESEVRNVNKAKSKQVIASNTEQPRKEGITKPVTSELPLNSSIAAIGKGKVKEIAKTLQEAAQLPSTPKRLEPYRNKAILNSENGKENSNIKLLHPFSCEKFRKGTPLATSNRLCASVVSASKPCGISVSKIIALKESEEAERKRKEEEQIRKLKKEEEVSKKREEKLKNTREKLRKKREEKMEKATRTREAAQREKFEQLSKLEKEREEREQIMAEIQRQKEEQILKKKLQNQLKAQEAEERRLKEESARLAKLKEQEEEQRKLAELRMKQLEEAEKLNQQRLAEEQRLKEASKPIKKDLEKVKLMEVYEMTPPKNEREPLPSKDVDDYGIDDINTDDSTDEESQPKKNIPFWATKSLVDQESLIESFVPKHIIEAFYVNPQGTPDLTEIFGSLRSKRVRTSSAVWPV